MILGGMAQEHERGAGGWQAEWAAVPDLFCYAGGAIARVARAVDGLQVDEARMRANLESSAGLVMADALATELSPRLGRPQAQRLVQALSIRARTESRALRHVALADPQVQAVLPPEQIDLTLDPGNNLGSAPAFIDRALGTYRALTSPEGTDAGHPVLPDAAHLVNVEQPDAFNAALLKFLT